MRVKEKSYQREKEEDAYTSDVSFLRLYKREKVERERGERNLKAKTARNGGERKRGDVFVSIFLLLRDFRCFLFIVVGIME